MAELKGKHMEDYYWQRTASGSLEKRPLAKTPPGAAPLFPASELCTKPSPDYDRLLGMIYHGTGFVVSFHNMEAQVKDIIKKWYEESL